jgi:hypothetical protein
LQQISRRLGQTCKIEVLLLEQASGVTSNAYAFKGSNYTWCFMFEASVNPRVFLTPDVAMTQNSARSGSAVSAFAHATICLCLNACLCVDMSEGCGK